MAENDNVTEEENDGRWKQRKNYMEKHIGRTVSVPASYFNDADRSTKYYGKVIKIVGIDGNQLKVKWKSDNGYTVTDFSDLTFESSESAIKIITRVHSI